MNESMYASVTPAILEFGQSYAKVGVAGEPHPRGIIKTYYSQEAYINVSQDNSLVVSKMLHWSQWKNKLYQLLHKIYFHYLRINSSEHKVCIIENPIMTINFKKALTCVLFETFHVPSIEFLPACKVPVYLCGVTTGLVLDAGYSGTRVLPIYYDVPVYEAIELVSLKSEKVDTLLYDCLREDPLNSSVVSVLECNKVSNLG
jgi:actin-related protein 10